MTIDKFICNLQHLNNLKFDLKSFSYSKKRSAKFLNDICIEIMQLENNTNIIFNDDSDGKPHQTIAFISEKLDNIITEAKKNYENAKLERPNIVYYKKNEVFFMEKTNFKNYLDDKFFLGINNFLNQSSNELERYDITIPNQEIKLNESEQLIIPSIYKYEGELKITIKKIDISIDPLIFNIENSPLQIRIKKHISEEIICKFEQTNDSLPLPIYRNENNFLIIEIPVKLIDRNNSTNQTFQFNGNIFLTTIYNLNTALKVEYNIVIRYISLIEFIRIKSNHFLHIMMRKQK